MPSANRPRGLWWSRFHFLIRFLGLTGLVAASVALTLAWRQNVLAGWPVPGSWSQVKELSKHTWEQITSAAQGAHWDEPKLLVTILLGGVAALLLMLVVELL